MGGHAYWYFVPYEHDVQAALDKLRARELAAGRYSPAIRYRAEEGTRSILDIDRIGKTLGFGVAAPLPAKRLTELYDTDRPTHAMVDNHEFFDDIPRGQCVYVIVYVDDKPSELFFAGYSYD
jgi:hypothetical protein